MNVKWKRKYILILFTQILISNIKNTISFVYSIIFDKKDTIFHNLFYSIVLKVDQR